MRFSIIVVTLNAGDKLKETVQSVLAQEFTDYEIVVKDGGSRDGSVEKLPQDGRISVHVKGDKGIYDAMNQAVALARGEYILFLNCGDLLYDRAVLTRADGVISREEETRAKTAEVIAEREAAMVKADAVLPGSGRPLVVYGDTYGAKNQVMIAAPREINGGICYRNIPCHQSCFYAAKLCKNKPYDLRFRIRADYDHFLWCYYQAKAKMVYLDGVVASYEGGGYSESKENRRRDKAEHKMITECYMSRGELTKYRLLMALSLAPLRSMLAENRLTSGLYHGIKELVRKKG
ncbi:MAG: glycosyltransferase [Lachnospiraceae bacterium]|nr:glycosyltransferase [Lachnospiraceae bacterium]